ncbi:MAG: DUF1475 domain-containing protein [Kiritimatiellae bacterium]|nr:DUF1475 domain-containing protein [Kiritimatiellia bacterium]
MDRQKVFFYALFCSIFAAMSWATVRASLDRNVIDATRELIRDPWVVAALFDAYFGFLTFYLWVYYKETRAAARLLWFVAIMLLGNFAMSFYVLRELIRLPPGQPVHLILLRRSHG